MRDAISPSRRLIATLKFLATGADLKDISSAMRIHPRTVSKFIPEVTQRHKNVMVLWFREKNTQVCSAIYKFLRRDYIKCPKTQEEWHSKAQEFDTLWQHPRAVAAIDGKHIEIQVWMTIKFITLCPFCDHFVIQSENVYWTVFAYNSS